MDEELLGGVAHTRAVSLGVDHDRHRLVEIGGCVNVNVAVPRTVDNDRHRRLRLDLGEQPGTTTGNQQIHPALGPQQLPGALPRGVLEHLHRILGNVGVGQAGAERRSDRHIGPQGGRGTAQQRGVARLQTQPGGVDRDVRPRLVDHRYHPERDADSGDVETVGQPPPSGDLTDRVG